MTTEKVTTMTPAEFDTLRRVLHDRWLSVKTKREKEIIRKLVNTICHNANTLTLKWLDEKRAEFP